MELMKRITRDVSDGILVLDVHGNVTFINPAAEKLLALKLKVGDKYAAVMLGDGSRENDSFHQLLLDAVYDKEQLHREEIVYTCPNGEKRVFRLSGSFLFGEDGVTREGVVISFSDITEESKYREKMRDSALIFILTVTMMAVCVFAYAIWDVLGRRISGSALAKILELCGFAACAFAVRFTGITFADMGLQIKGAGRYILKDGIFTAVILAAAVAVKFFGRMWLPGIFPPENPFFYWNTANFSDYFYPVTVVAQEFLTRGIMHESIRRIIPGKHSNEIAIITSSLFFGVVHIQLGLPYMFGSFLLLGVFGIIYTKQKTIWGLCIPHFFLGEMLKFLFGFY